MAFFALEKAHRLYDGYFQAFNVRGLQLLLVQDGSQIHLIENRCPHMDAPLNHARIINGHIRCPMHGIEFNLSNGQPKNGVGGCIKRYKFCYEGNQIGIDL